MKRKSLCTANCPIARTLDVIGDWWSLLIVRDAFLGVRRFEQFQASLGIARNVLTDRLNRLVDEGILERVRYSERPERYEYRLTRKGRDLHLALTGLRQWGDKYASQKPPTLTTRAEPSQISAWGMESRKLIVKP